MADLIQKKICLLGDFAVGKTSLVRRFVEGRFDDNYLSTIGVKISRKEIQVDSGTSLRLIIWDLVGNGKFENVSTKYLMGTSGALIVCDLTRTDTFQSLKHYKEILHGVASDSQVSLLANKVDLIEDTGFVSGVESIASELDVSLHITSAKTGDNVEEAFLSLASKLISKE